MSQLSIFALIPNNYNSSHNGYSINTSFSAVILAFSLDDAWKKINLESFHLCGPNASIKQSGIYSIEQIKTQYKMVLVIGNCVIFTA